MTAQEILDDMNERLRQAWATIMDMAAVTYHPGDAMRLAGKAEGIALARDYLRGYSA